MRQIFDRIFRIARSYSDSQKFDAKHYDINGDDALRAAIDELDKERNTKKENNNFYKKQSRQNNEKKQSDNSQKTDTDLDLKSASATLGISEQATIEQIKAAYKQKIRQYHPDKVQNLGEDIREVAAKKTIEINVAYQFFKKLRGFN